MVGLVLAVLVVENLPATPVPEVDPCRLTNPFDGLVMKNAPACPVEPPAVDEKAMLPVPAELT